MRSNTNIVDYEKNFKLLSSNFDQTTSAEILDILTKAEKFESLSLEDCAKLLLVEDETLLDAIFYSANKVKSSIYGSRIVLFAPLYVSNFCINDCAYCGFHASNKNFQRKKLTLQEIREQTEILINFGHKRLLLEFGEHPENSAEYMVDVINTIYDVKCDRDNQIKRVNINSAALRIEEYKLLKSAKVGTYQLFQETYDQITYQQLHRSGPKKNYERQITAHIRAIESGIDDFGMGVLFGLYDFKFEILALLQHIRFLEKNVGIGPHTISVPRVCSADTVSLNLRHRVNDKDFLKIIAILRLAVPYSGIIISTRESETIRKKAFNIGVSQASAASCTVPGGYRSFEKNDVSSHVIDRSIAQFKIKETRNLDDIVQDICKLGFLPSFCTACYRNKRTGSDFMQLAKNCKIGKFCQLNAILTFQEYLLDYASLATKKLGDEVIVNELKNVKNARTKSEIQAKLKAIHEGKRDVYF